MEWAGPAGTRPAHSPTPPPTAPSTPPSHLPPWTRLPSPAVLPSAPHPAPPLCAVPPTLRPHIVASVTGMWVLGGQGSSRSLSPLATQHPGPGTPPGADEGFGGPLSSHFSGTLGPGGCPLFSNKASSLTLPLRRCRIWLEPACVTAATHEGSSTWHRQAWSPSPPCCFRLCGFGHTTEHPCPLCSHLDRGNENT